MESKIRIDTQAFYHALCEFHQKINVVYQADFAAFERHLGLKYITGDRNTSAYHVQDARKYMMAKLKYSWL